VTRWLAAALLIGAAASTPAISSVAHATATVAGPDKAAETFDAVWTIVRDSIFDPAFDRAAWDRVRDELRPKAVAAPTAGELRAVLRDMLGRLGLSHFAVIPATPDAPDQYVDLSAEPGFDVRLIDGQVVVSSVEAGGGAAAASVHTGWIVHAIDGAPVAGFLQGVVDAVPPRMAQLEMWRTLATKLRGPYDSHVEVTFLDGSGATIVKSIARRPEQGDPVKVGSLPTMYVQVSSSLTETPHGRTAGIIGFNVWMTAVDREFQRAMDRYRTADGIVIDLRGNPGGLAAMVMGIAGHFTASRDTLGVMTMKDRSELRFNANPRLVNAEGQRVEPYQGPLAILVDGMTGSASECFAGGMQSLGRARIFGQTSMGQALPALFDKLPNGDVLIHAWGDFVTGTGVRIEGRGVVPDEPVALTRASLLAGRDATLDAALAWIDAQATKGTPSRN
jgi:carboxyl-terminal processing protease